MKRKFFLPRAVVAVGLEQALVTMQQRSRFLMTAAHAPGEDDVGAGLLTIHNHPCTVLPGTSGSWHLTGGLVTLHVTAGEQAAQHLPVDRLQPRGCPAHPFHHGLARDRRAPACEEFLLAKQRKVVDILGDEHPSEQSGRGVAAGHRPRGRGRHHGRLGTLGLTPELRPTISRLNSFGGTLSTSKVRSSPIFSKAAGSTFTSSGRISTVYAVTIASRSAALVNRRPR